MQEPEVNFLSSGSTPQSASEKALMEIGTSVEAGCSKSPRHRDPLRYLRILLTATQWLSRGKGQELTNFVHSKTNFRPSDGCILQGTYYRPVKIGIPEVVRSMHI